MKKFRVGQRVRNIETGERGTVVKQVQQEIIVRYDKTHVWSPWRHMSRFEKDRGAKRDK